MADSKSKSEQKREQISANAEAQTSDGLSNFYYPELGRSVRAADRETADKLIETEIDKEASGKADGEGTK